MTRPLLATATILCVAALGTGAWFVNEWHTCRELEDRLFTLIEGYRRNVEASALASAVGVEIDRNEQQELREMSLDLQERLLTYIYKRCGADAGDRAAALARETLGRGY